MVDEAAVALLLDRTAVSDVVRRYFMALDQFDWDRVASCLDDMYHLEAVAPGVASAPVPREEFMTNLRRRNGGFTQTVHINPGHIVEIDGDTATVTTHCWAAHGVGSAPEDVMWAYGMYHFLAVRRSAGWKLSHQRIELVGEFGNPGDIFARSVERQDAGLGRG